MMLVLAIGVGLAIAIWSWRLAGPLAALAATTLWALDPNFLAHGPLVKNDVPLTVCFTIAIASAWSVGKRATVTNLSLLVLSVAAAPAIKFSGLLLIPVVAGLLVCRCL